MTKTDKARLIEILRNIQRNTKGYDPMSNNGINYEYTIEALSILLKQPVKRKPK